MTAKQAVRFSIFTIDEEAEDTQGNQLPHIDEEENINNNAMNEMNFEALQERSDLLDEDEGEVNEEEEDEDNN
jgi:hypothetical protein